MNDQPILHTGASFFAAVLALAAVIVFFRWLIKDAGSRGKSGCLVCLLVLFLQIPGLLIWLVFRPEKRPESHLFDR